MPPAASNAAVAKQAGVTKATSEQVSSGKPDIRVVAPKSTPAPKASPAALKRSGDQAGNVIVFLPGWKEMCQVQQDLLKAFPRLNVLMLHSELVGDENEDKVVMSEVDGQMVVLSTVIGARSVSLSGMKYVITHPQMRCSALRASGFTRIKDYLVS